MYLVGLLKSPVAFLGQSCNIFLDGVNLVPDGPCVLDKAQVIVLYKCFNFIKEAVGRFCNIIILIQVQFPVLQFFEILERCGKLRNGG